MAIFHKTTTACSHPTAATPTAVAAGAYMAAVASVSFTHQGGNNNDGQTVISTSLSRVTRQTTLIEKFSNVFATGGAKKPAEEMDDSELTAARESYPAAGNKDLDELIWHALRAPGARNVVREEIEALPNDDFIALIEKLARYPNIKAQIIAGVVGVNEFLTSSDVLALQPVRDPGMNPAICLLPEKMRKQSYAIIQRLNVTCVSMLARRLETYPCILAFANIGAFGSDIVKIFGISDEELAKLQAIYERYPCTIRLIQEKALGANITTFLHHMTDGNLQTLQDRCNQLGFSTPGRPVISQRWFNVEYILRNPVLTAEAEPALWTQIRTRDAQAANTGGTTTVVS